MGGCFGKIFSNDTNDSNENSNEISKESEYDTENGHFFDYFYDDKNPYNYLIYHIHRHGVYI